ATSVPGSCRRSFPGWSPAISAGSRSRSRVALSSTDPDREAVARRREGTHPARVVAARRVVREVEVENEPAALAAEVGALDGVEEVAPGAVGLVAARRVGEAQVHAASVAVQPVQVEGLSLPVEGEDGPREPRERVRMLAGGCDLALQAFGRLD